MKAFKIYNIFYLIIALLGIVACFNISYHYSIGILLFICYLFSLSLGLCALKKLFSNSKEESKNNILFFHFISALFFLIINILAFIHLLVFSSFYFGFITIVNIATIVLSLVEIVLVIVLVILKKTLLLPNKSELNSTDSILILTDSMKTFVLLVAVAASIALSAATIYCAAMIKQPITERSFYSHGEGYSNIISNLLSIKGIFAVLLAFPLFIVSIICLVMVAINKTNSKKYKIYSLILSLGALSLCVYSSTVVFSPIIDVTTYDQRIEYSFLEFLSQPISIMLMAFFFVAQAVLFAEESTNGKNKKIKSPLWVVIIFSISGITGLALFIINIIKNSTRAVPVMFTSALLLLFSIALICLILKKKNILKHSLIGAIGFGIITVSLILNAVSLYKQYLYCSSSIYPVLFNASTEFYVLFKSTIFGAIVSFVAAFLYTFMFVFLKIKNVESEERELTDENSSFHWSDKYSVIFKIMPLIVIIICFDFLGEIFGAYDATTDYHFATLIDYPYPLIGAISLILTGLFIDLLCFNKSRKFSKIANIILGTLFLVVLIVFACNTSSEKLSYYDESHIFHHVISYTYLYLVVFIVFWLPAVVLEFTPAISKALIPFKEKRAKIKLEKIEKQKQEEERKKAEAEEKRRQEELKRKQFEEEQRRLAEEAAIRRQKQLENEKREQEEKQRLEAERQKEQQKIQASIELDKKFKLIKDAKEMLDCGAITQDEFDKLKREILNENK